MSTFTLVLPFTLMLQASEHAPAETLAQTFGVDWSHLLAQLISFSIVCALLYRFAYAPVLAMLSARRDQIAQGLANTAKIEARLAEIEAQRQVLLAEARNEASRLVADARIAARRLNEAETQRAAAEAGDILTRAREAAALEHARMLNQLRGEVGRLVVLTTAAVADKVLTADDHRRLAEGTAKALAAR